MTEDEARERIQRIIDAALRSIEQFPGAAANAADAIRAWSLSVDVVVREAGEALSVDDRLRYHQLREAGAMPVEALEQLLEEKP